MICFDLKYIGSSHVIHRAACFNIDASLSTFGEEHFDNLPRTLAAEQLSERFLVKRDLVFLDQLNKILRRVAGASGF